MSTPTHVLTGLAIGKIMIAAGIPVDPLRVFEVAVVSANLPDIDVIRYGITPAHHKSILHKPAVWIGAIALVWTIAAFRLLPISLPLLGVFAVGILSHFVLDTGNCTTGVQWLWPWSPRISHYFAFAVRPNSHRKLFSVYLHHAAFRFEASLWATMLGYLTLSPIR
jgi:membrane-bound metal-dependent hydrolase YbcI (DUF457 family)